MKLRMAIVTMGAVLAAGALPASAGVIAFHFGGGDMVLAPGGDVGGGGWGSFGPLDGSSGSGRAWLADIAAGLGVGGWHSAQGGWGSGGEGGNARHGVGSAAALSGGGGGGGGSSTSRRGGSGGGAGGGGGTGGGSGSGGSGYGYSGFGGSQGRDHGIQFAPIDPSRPWTRSPWVTRPNGSGWHDGWDGHMHDHDCDHDDDDGSGGAAVPEPATLLLLGSGLVGLGLRRRRQA